MIGRIDGETAITVGLITALLPIAGAIWRLGHNVAKVFGRIDTVDARSVEADKRSRHNAERLNRLESRGQPYNRRRAADRPRGQDDEADA